MKMSLIGIFIAINLVSIVLANDYSASASSEADASASAFNNQGCIAIPPVYSECGAECPRTCEHPENGICFGMCRPGYSCPNGLYLNSNNLCVELNCCPSYPTVPVNGSDCKSQGKIYNECGTACPKTCAQPEDRPCTRECKPGCFCPNGLYENEAGLCVELKDCNRPHSHPLIPATGPPTNTWNSEPQNFDNFPGFQFGGLSGNNNAKIGLSTYSYPSARFEIDPIRNSPMAIANGGRIPPPAVVRTSGSDSPTPRFPATVPNMKPLIDLDPTVPRPVLRVSRELTSDDDQ